METFFPSTSLFWSIPDEVWSGLANIRFVLHFKIPIWELLLQKDPNVCLRKWVWEHVVPAASTITINDSGCEEDIALELYIEAESVL